MYITAYFVTTLIFIIADALWLGVIAKNFYFSQLGHLMREDVQMYIAAVFYLTYTAGIVYLAVLPALKADQLLLAGINGAVLGFMAYGTYNFTNMSTLKDWPYKMSMLDVCWGTILTGLTAFTTAYIMKSVLKF